MTKLNDISKNQELNSKLVKSITKTTYRRD